MEQGRDARFHYETAPVLVGLSEFQRVNVKTPSETKVLADMIRNLVRSDRNFGSHHLVQLARVIFSDRSDPLQKLAHEINKLVWQLPTLRVHVRCTSPLVLTHIKTFWFYLYFEPSLCFELHP